MKALRAAKLLAASDGLVPAGADAALLLRHAERERIPAGEFGVDVPLTASGIASAERLGRALAARPAGVVVASPVPRCVQTAQAIARGAEWRCAVETDSRLGDHGPFVTDAKRAGELFLEIGIAEIVRRQLHDPLPPPGMRRVEEGVNILLEFLAGGLGEAGRTHVHVTHDAILAPLMGWLFGMPVHQRGWPGFLDALLFWRCAGTLHTIPPGGAAQCVPVVWSGGSQTARFRPRAEPGSAV